VSFPFSLFLYRVLIDSCSSQCTSGQPIGSISKVLPKRRRWDTLRRNVCNVPPIYAA